MGQVYALADAIGQRYRALVLLACFCGLRWGRAGRTSPQAHRYQGGPHSHPRSLSVELTNGALVTGPPKSASGIRWVSVPPFLLPDVIEHLEQFTGAAEDQLVFAGPKGAQLRRKQLHPSMAQAALEAAGMTASTFTTCRRLPATRWPVRPGPASANSWTGWATAPRVLR